MSRMTAPERLAYAVRIAITHSLYYTGLLQLIVRVRLRRKAIVLAYHRVLTPQQRTELSRGTSQR
jgi:hypothetical protein